MRVLFWDIEKSISNIFIWFTNFAGCRWICFPILTWIAWLFLKLTFPPLRSCIDGFFTGCKVSLQLFFFHLFLCWHCPASEGGIFKLPSLRFFPCCTHDPILFSPWSVTWVLSTFSCFSFNDREGRTATSPVYSGVRHCPEFTLFWVCSYKGDFQNECWFPRLKQILLWRVCFCRH